MRFLAIFLLVQSLCFAAFEIGTVIAVQGTVKAQREKIEEMLHRGAAVFLHDLIDVAEESRAQIKLVDGTLLSLIPDTQYRIDKFVMRGSKEKDEFASELIKGGLRGITGSIGKENPAGVTIKTPTATMGLRGTIFEIRIVGDKTYFGCESGEVSVSNKAGLVYLGPYVERQFASTSSDGQAPQVLAKRPSTLNINNFVAPRGSSCQ